MYKIILSEILLKSAEQFSFSVNITHSSVFFASNYVPWYNTEAGCYRGCKRDHALQELIFSIMSQPRGKR